MQPGERATVDARDEILVRVGNAGALAYLINGEPGRQLGRLGEVVTVRITKGNYDTWLKAIATMSGTLTVPRERGSAISQSIKENPGGFVDADDAGQTEL